MRRRVPQVVEQVEWEEALAERLASAGADIPDRLRVTPTPLGPVKWSAGTCEDCGRAARWCACAQVMS